MRKGKICALMMTLCLLLAACGRGGAGDNDQLALEIRAAYLAMNGCSATIDITADYGRRVYDYTMAMTWARDGDTLLVIQAPESIAGVTARIGKESASLEYEGVSLETGTLDDQGLSPIGAIPVLLTSAREAFIAESASEPVGEIPALKLTYREPEAVPGTGREISIWFHTETYAPIQAEILSDGARVIYCAFRDVVMT